ncbi:MAG TPA: NUDIX-like domain-containing protein, partial [Acidimicrobiales bacterium]|nr:NUDIX-like domain-containing protein [Acidimicrobiales bacterium]
MDDAFLSLIRPPEGVDSASRAHRFVVRNGEVLVADDGEWPYGLAAELDLDVGEEPLFLGTLKGEPVWAVGVDADVDMPTGLRFEPLMALATRLPADRWALAGRAVQVVEWQRTHRFCGRC